MDIKQAQALGAVKSSLTSEQLAKFSAELMADHDAIITIEDLVANHDETPKEERKKIFALLENELKKYPGMVTFHDELFGKPLLALRAKVEHFRGCSRDINGKIILTEDQLKEKIAERIEWAYEFLAPDAKLDDKHGPKVEQLKAEIAHYQGYLDGTKKWMGSIWDHVRGTTPTEVVPKPATVPEGE